MSVGRVLGAPLAARRRGDPMSSLVSEFIINPVLRQARRFSEISRSTLAGDEDHPNSVAPLDAVSDAGDTDEAAEAGPGDDVPPAPQTPRSRPLSTSTEETRVDDAAASPAPRDDIPRDHLGFPVTPRKGRGIPEDDGMRELRSRIHAINAQDIPQADKARRIHDMLLEGYRASRSSIHNVVVPPSSPGQDPALHAYEPSAAAGTLESLKFWNGQFGDAPSTKFDLTESDLAPTYAPIRQPKTPDGQSPTSEPPSPSGTSPPLGCQHYERNVKLQCSTCSKWYTCRFCHDAHEDHNLIRKETKHMLCMLCGTPQKASDVCINCGEISAQYYCNICKLWENRKSKPIYHCNDCGICRRGLGLGKDFFHCKTCRACITTSIQSSHKCIERSTDCDCPICGEYMFTSPKPVVFMPCGHSIHKKCYEQHMRRSYKCPICNKSLANMEMQFRILEAAIQNQPMPPEFRDTKATVLCNDCSGKSTVPYHWLGLKCSICKSYNTVELQIHGDGNQFGETSGAVAPAPAQAAQSQARAETESTGPRIGTLIPNRRRHSSHGVEASYRAPDRVARSLSPLPSGRETLQPNAAIADVDSEDDIFGFWRVNRADDEPSGPDESESESESEQESDGLPEIDEEDDEDEIVLIGHR
ncbi:CHY zinc finger domain-containingprotein [Purpureocillium lavendulum]|uniref:CHY zinc finger domain-containingprotein n=1 Tax=Purpureocillium lavendulum TaxID=1247861 RepID=A0AB34FLC4_9HYPO|nr:CHY zinc finger domain-containingprotein [Purpureocillium lavendulum]